MTYTRQAIRHETARQLRQRVHLMRGNYGKDGLQHPGAFGTWEPPAAQAALWSAIGGRLRVGAAWAPAFGVGRTSSSGGGAQFV